MYKATNIDTDKALKAINDSRAIQERASQLRSEKERSYMEGLNKGLDIAESLLNVQIMRNRRRRQLIQMVSARYSMNLEKNLIYQLRI